MSIDEALSVIEGNCAILFENVGEPEAWRQRQAFAAIKAELDELRFIVANTRVGTTTPLASRAFPNPYKLT